MSHPQKESHQHIGNEKPGEPTFNPSYSPLLSAILVGAIYPSTTRRKRNGVSRSPYLSPLWILIS